MSTHIQKIELRGNLTSEDMHQTKPFYIDVPDGVTNIHFLFSHNPRFGDDQKLPNQISLMIFDTNGPRFEISRPDEQGVFINSARTSPGGTPGPIPAGRWMVFVLVFRLLSDTPVDYELTVSMSFEPIEEEPLMWPAGRSLGRGPGWYRGDLHAHTIHSDGSWDIPDIIDFWKARGADFMTLSDHNTISGLAQVRSMADDQLLTMGGIELSTFFGHAVALGVTQWFDWRKLDGSQITVPELAQNVIDSGALFIIAHPMHPGDPGCCGCRWEYDDMMPGNASAVEIWNGDWESSDQEALQLFYHWLNQGHRLTATAGTDLHGPPPAGVRGAVNVVYAEDLNESAIIEAIKAGRSYISAGPELLLNVRTESGVEAMIGDSVPQEAVTIIIRWRDGHDGDYIRLVVDGRAYHEKIVGPSGVQEWHLDAGQRQWCNVELRDADDGLWAVSNPIFFSPSD
ncbi:MAG: CehA/McbA family metallohydrolase [Chloroflexota bacterium]|nr:CehA/McbA family metallohydrolase [Chloroflexota bacterium]